MTDQGKVSTQNVIPPITDPLGRNWTQPDPRRFLIDDTHAVVTLADFSRLHDYSTTLPSGVYPGKVWRMDIGLARRYTRGMFDSDTPLPPSGWLLRWFGECDDPSLCSINQRILLIADGDLPASYPSALPAGGRA